MTLLQSIFGGLRKNKHDRQLEKLTVELARLNASRTIGSEQRLLKILENVDSAQKAMAAKGFHTKI